MVVAGVEKPFGSRCRNSRKCSVRAARKPDVRSGMRCAVRRLASAFSRALPSRRPTLACVDAGRAPTTRSYSASRASRRAASSGRCWPSPSMISRCVPVAARMPLLTAAPLPLLSGWRMTRAPASRAAVEVSSVEPSSTTRISRQGPTCQQIAHHGGDAVSLVVRRDHHRGGRRISHVRSRRRPRRRPPPSFLRPLLRRFAGRRTAPRPPARSIAPGTAAPPSACGSPR